MTQETLTKTPEKITAANRSISRMAGDISLYDRVLPETRELIIDEERTHAAEILARLTGNANILREYELVDGELIDKHGVSVHRVLRGGIEDIDQKIASGVVGAEDEKVRRVIEQDTLQEIAALPEGFLGVEISATDLDKPEAERASHGYSGDALVRITARISETRFLQANIVSQVSDIDFINRVRGVIDADSEKITSAVDALRDFQTVGLGPSDFEVFVSSIEREIRTLEAEMNPAKATFDMIKKWHQKKTDAWKFVQEQEDVFDELIDAFEITARQEQQWQELANYARTGAWQELIDRFEGKSKKTEKGTLIEKGAKRAIAAQQVFVACHGSIDTREFQKNGTAVSFADRISIAMSLMDRYMGTGVCASCAAKGSLYGCGVFCKGCNDVWCGEYMTTGRQLEPAEMKGHVYLRYGRGYVESKVGTESSS